MASQLRIATRRSPLAQWQARWVSERILEVGRASGEIPGIPELVFVDSEGDRNRTQPLAQIGGQGLFTKAVQEAVLAGDAELAVHSLKDLPTEPTPGLILVAVPTRDSIYDALISPQYRTLENLPQGARLGTSSPRRQAQLMAIRPDLQLVDLRGNVQTRIEHVTSGKVDGIVLAQAGLIRLRLATLVTEILRPPRFFPAVSQGALGVECCANDREVSAILSRIDSRTIHAQVMAERAALNELQGGCSVPVGAWTDIQGETLHLHMAVIAQDGSSRLVADQAGLIEQAEQIGRELARTLIDRGASQLLFNR